VIDYCKPSDWLLQT